MGSSFASIDQEFIREKFLHLLQQSQRDPIYGQYRLVTDQGGMKQFAWSVNRYKDSDAYDATIKRLQQIQTLNHPNLSKLMLYETSVQNEYCSFVKRIDQLNEYHSYKLSHETEGRQSKNLFYTQGEIAYIAQSSIQALYTLWNTHNMYHGNISQNTIMLDTQGHLQIILCPFNGKIIEENKNTSNNQNVNYSIEREDIYNLGLILYKAITMKPIHDKFLNYQYFYDNNEYREEMNILIQFVFPQYYNQILYQMLLAPKSTIKSVYECLGIYLNPFIAEKQVSFFFDAKKPQVNQDNFNHEKLVDPSLQPYVKSAGGFEQYLKSNRERQSSQTSFNHLSFTVNQSNSYNNNNNYYQNMEESKFLNSGEIFDTSIFYKPDYNNNEGQPENNIGGIKIDNRMSEIEQRRTESLKRTTQYSHLLKSFQQNQL